MRFVIHIGTHKTGSSSIQAFCAENRDIMLSRGVVYPLTRHSNKNLNHLAAVIARGQPAELERLVARAAKLATRNNARVVLLSTESFYAMAGFFTASKAATSATISNASAPTFNRYAASFRQTT